MPDGMRHLAITECRLDLRAVRGFELDRALSLGRRDGGGKDRQANQCRTMHMASTSKHLDEIDPPGFAEN